MNPEAITIIAYLTIVTLVGVYLANRNKSSDDWAIGAGSMGVFLVAAGIAGTRIGGVGTYGVAGDVVSTGIWNIWYGINTILALALVGLFFAIPYRRLRLTTVSQLFVQRHGSGRNAWLTSLCVQTEYLIINILEPLLIGIILSNVFDIPRTLGIYIGALIIICATALSGLRGTAVTNVIHCAVIIFGLGAVGIIAGQKLGGFSAVVEKVDINLNLANIDPAGWWSIVGLGWFPIIAMFFSATIHTPAASVYVNYSSSARKESILIPAFLLAGVIAAIMPFLSAVIGVEAVAKYGVNSSLTSYNSITAIATDAGPIIGGIALAAVLAALISSGAPILLASSTLFVNDWLLSSHELLGIIKDWSGKKTLTHFPFARRIHALAVAILAYLPNFKDWSPTQKLKSYRITSVVYGLVAASMACVLPINSVLELLLLGFAMVVPPAIAIAYIFYWKSTTEQGVFWGIASGYGLGLIAWASNSLYFNLEHDVAAYFTTLVPVVVIPVVSLLTQSAGNRDTRSDDFYRRLKTPA
jgi:Na+/proline symporter